VTALAEAELVPFRYVVVDASLTVTFWPAAVVKVKVAVDTLSTVPDEPPAAGPDRPLPPPDPGLLGAALDGLLLAAAPDVLVLERECTMA